MSWQQTFTGRMFWPLDPRPEDLDILDVAHALSLQCRFGGHCREHYSVAQHSVEVAWLLPQHLRLEGLLHDAAEAYLVDLPRPVKRSMPDYVAAERRLERVIAERFSLVYPWPDSVHRADEIMLATEARDLLGPAPAAWNLREAPRAEPLVPWKDAAPVFLALFYQHERGREA